MLTPQISTPNKNNSIYLKRRSSLSNYDLSGSAFRNSISKGVKYGDITIITKRTSHGAADELVPDIAGEKTEEAFDSIRKKYDKYKKQTSAKQKSIEKLKQALNRAKQQEELYRNKRDQARQVSGDLEKKMIQSRSLLEFNEMERKSFDAVLNRLKNDAKHINDKALRLQIQHRDLSKLLKSAAVTDTTTNAQSLRTKAIQEILEREISKQTELRENHIQDLHLKIQDILNTNRQFQIRDNQIREIAERAIQDKDQNQKWWRRALMTNKFVSKFLQNKMHIQMEKFNVIQTAFKNIKIATSVADGPTMVTRYLQKQKIYGRLLDSIAKSQKQIQRLKSQMDVFLKNKKELEDDIAQLDTNKKNNPSNLSNEIHKLNAITDKNTKTQLCSFKMNQWLNRQHKKIAHFIPEHVSTYPEQKIKTNFQEYLAWLEAQTLNLNEIEEQVDIHIDARKKYTQQGQFEPQIADNEIFEQNQLIDNFRTDRIKKDQKFFEKLKKQRLEQVMIQIEQQAKVKFTKLEKQKQKPGKEQDQKQKQKQEAKQQ